ncbi:CBS domain-containing protein [Kribbella shirazensis]|uniref:CBS domain-containing protein n=1 Tax=Kribbella shirazensis TaxID=1105143 RepID=A0A7X5VDE4_9ACTN|nr:CBS domain-containing protein [Kribbella shirazensis]NIK59190.1 CBS domain-containing protein [Kribbella shirazensis]
MMRHYLTVSDVMTKDVVTVAEDTPFKAVAGLLAEHHISAVPVRDVYGGVAGVVSETDLLRKEEFQRARLPRWSRRRARAKAEALTAGQLMTCPPVTVEGGCTLDEAARLMAARGLTRLVVTNGDKLVGIVSRSDLLSAYLASDQETLARVRRDVVDRHLWEDPRTVEVSVVEGVVTLTGQVEKRSTSAFAEHLTAGIDGVVAVRNELTWAVDDLSHAPGGIFY